MNPFFRGDGDPLAEQGDQVHFRVFSSQPDSEFDIAVLQFLALAHHLLQLQEQALDGFDVPRFAGDFDMVFPGGDADVELLFDLFEVEVLGSEDIRNILAGFEE